MIEGRRRPLLRAAGEGELIDVAGVRHLFRLTAEDTGGAFGFEEFTLEPGIVGARPHIHWEHDEYFYVLEGELTLHTGDGEIIAGPRHLLAARRGAPHGFRNAGDEAVTGLCMYTPAGYEGYFRDVHAAAGTGVEITDALLAEFRSRYATESIYSARYGHRRHYGHQGLFRTRQGLTYRNIRGKSPFWDP